MRFPFGKMMNINLIPSITLKLLKFSGTLKEKSVLNDVDAKSGDHLSVEDWSPFTTSETESWLLKLPGVLSPGSLPTTSTPK